MSFPKIFFGVLLLAASFSLLVYLMSTVATPINETGSVGEWDITVPRAPSEAKAMKNPIERTPEVISQGAKLFLGKASCYLCHGVSGRGDGESGALLNPAPRDFTNARFQNLRTDGELFWVIVHGSPGTGMFSYAPRFLSEEEAWMVIHYLRTLSKEDH